MQNLPMMKIMHQTYQRQYLIFWQTNLHIIGSPFQIKVWRALLKIKAGQVVTYSDVAAEIDQPSSVRAVGTAIGRNPISFLIPCHIRPCGYHWGRKNEYLLAFEK